MKLFGLNSAEYIKCKFIDFMLSKNYELIIGNELMYGIKRKLVDLVVLKNNKIFAVEIKSNSDNLNRLKEQIEEYKKVFNYVLVVTTEKFKNRILDTVSSDIGVYIIEADLSLHKIRSPRIQNDRNKIEILYSINAKFLSKIGHYSLQKYNAERTYVLDVMFFNSSDGFGWTTGRGTTKLDDWTPWVGRRASQGRTVPVGFPRSGKFGK